ncbi:glycosyltransferase family 2 protein [Dyadobacter chenwenxiniae]|uniref:Glycosyltransferase family 2 protein n=1 Tax=Dyadobacter chenwenxiniae TaxID=2906456 RepID=A0A9X1PJY4_9BACT|nr:glycosyltransferase family 2 protein [Dyadobacter chenwenxiniae]MCF0062717.1 glycosyltransferase family 2 protein [Dyadobacter chenwenxiniae]UON83538.1 glycosyltransferase family 2 protein [Dyadobacter chenwenxiniae]
MKYSIAVLVVTYNRLTLLKECINALRMQTYRFDSLFVINNGSTDGTEEWLSSQKDLKIITQQNSGGAGGFHTGIKAAMEENFDYLWLMDDDVIPLSDALEQLIKVKESNTDFSFLASLVKGKNGNIINVPVLNSDKSLDTNYPVWADKFESGLIKLQQATFVSILVNTATIKKVGLPIKEFFIWGDDYEYTARLSAITPAYFVGSSVVRHMRALEKSPALNEEVEDNRIKFHFYAVRNNVYLIKQNNTLIKRIFKCLTYPVFMIKSIIGSRKTVKKINVILKGFIAGIFFNPDIEYIDTKNI